MAKKRNRLADRLQEAANDPSNRGDGRYKTWFTRLPEDDQQDLIEVREGHRAGKYPAHCTAQWFYTQLRIQGVRVPSYDTFRRWLYRGE